MGRMKIDPEEFITESGYKAWMTRGFPQRGDLLFTTEAPMGNVCEIQTSERFALAQRTINLHPFADLCSRYLMFVIMSKPIQEWIEQLATGMTAKGIKAAKLRYVGIPIPPLAEQKRIVAKVDRLLTQCDRVVAQLQARQTTTEQLLTASIHRLLDQAN